MKASTSDDGVGRTMLPISFSLSFSLALYLFLFRLFTYAILASSSLV